jgi:septal ring factor EnvC (AmiA/AmiB activator)
MTDQIRELVYNIEELESQVTELINFLERIEKYLLNSNANIDELEKILEKIKYFKESNYGSTVA